MTQNFTVTIRLPKKDDCGNEIKGFTEGEIVRAVRAKAPLMAVVEAEEQDTIRERIHDVLRRYFECDANGDTNPQFDDCLTAQDAIDEIHGIVGEFFVKPNK